MANKVKTVYSCQNCGANSPKWVGKCPTCGEWNTYVEEVISKSTTPAKDALTSIEEKSNRPRTLLEIDASAESRMQLYDGELNRILGGGLVPGSLVLIGGEPGIGKSTLMLQVALLQRNLKVLYISGEESERQIRMRAERIGVAHEHCYILTETATQSLFKHAKQLEPDLVIVDSIQTLHTPFIESTAGSVSQIRECAGELLRYAKASNVPVLLIGHITKDGNLAGPKVLEHMVDTVLQFEGDRHHIYRLLRATKNRFGSTNELGIYEMQGDGLREVTNPSEVLISHRDKSLSGIAISATMEGMRPLLIETQALVSTAAYGTPQRSSTGFDLRRLNMLLAVLEKRCGFRLGAKDVFLNIAGGIRVDDPAIDLAVVCAVLSSSEDLPIGSGSCFAAEVGLSGEIRAVSRLEQRIGEADKLGFERIFVSAYNLKGVDTARFKLDVIPVKKIEEVFRHLFG